MRDLVSKDSERKQEDMKRTKRMTTGILSPNNRLTRTKADRIHRKSITDLFSLLSFSLHVLKLSSTVSARLRCAEVSRERKKEVPEIQSFISL